MTNQSMAEEAQSEVNERAIVALAREILRVANAGDVAVYDPDKISLDRLEVMGHVGIARRLISGLNKKGFKVCG